MANVKNAGVREIILDRCLRKRKGYTISELQDKVNTELTFHDLPPRYIWQYDSQRPDKHLKPMEPAHILVRTQMS